MSNQTFDRINVLNKGYVELQSVMGDDISIVNAARVSFLGDSKGEEADKKLLFYLMRHEHMSPFEMVEFKFRIHAPVVTWWQMVRHRTANINLQSGRYTVYEEDEFYVPDVWRLQSKSNKQGSDGTVEDNGENSVWYSDKLTKHYQQSYLLYKDVIDAGVAKEQARLFLPAWGLYYTGIWKIDARNLMNFLRLRTAADAQFEIRIYAEALHGFFKLVLPWTEECFSRRSDV